MTAVLTILTEQDLRDYVRGALPAQGRRAVEAAVANDPDAAAWLAKLARRLDDRRKEMTMTSEVLQARTDVAEPNIGLRDEKRRRLALALQGVLADTYLLMVKTQSYHWNVVGPLFVSLHKLTEDQYRSLFEAADTIAERIRALGYPAPFGFAEMIPNTQLVEDAEPRTAERMIRNLVEDHEAVARRLRTTIEIADTQDDHATSDLLTQRIADHEQAIWMLRALVSH